MRNDFLSSAEKINKERVRKHSRNRFLTILACIVVFCTIYALIIPAITMEAEKKLLCTEETLSGHVHTANCKDDNGILVCGYADFVIHSHDSSCYDDKGNLICALTEVKEHTHNQNCFSSSATVHIHSDDCYSYKQVLSCGQPLHEGHTHTEDCYDDSGALICGQEESEGHVHTADCYTSVQDGLICGYDDSAQADASSQLVCDKPEIIFHKHTPECFDKNEALVCEKTQILKHEHTEDCFESTKPVSEDLQDDKNESEIVNMSYEGSDYTVSVSYPKSCLPENAELAVEEILPSNPEYADYYEQTTQLLPEERGLLFCRFFDVSFLSDGAKVEPTASVDVQISYKESIPQDETVTCNAVHFAEDGVEMLPAQISESEDGGDTISFSQDSFSVVGTAISTLNLSDGSYIFYKDGYAIGAYGYGIRPVAITVDENGYVYPTNTAFPIANITWTYKNGGLYNAAMGKYLTMATSVDYSDSAVTLDARIVNNAVRFSRPVYGTTTTYYLGNAPSSSSEYISGTLFATGDYFLAAKVANVSDVEIEQGDLEVDDQIKKTGNIVPKLNISGSDGHTFKYKWYRSDDDGTTWNEVVRTKITGESYNVAEDGSWLNVALDKGAEKLYKVELYAIDDSQVSEKIESIEYRIPYYDSIQNGNFEEPAISTDVSDNEHYQPLLPNGTAGMVWKTTAGDGEIEYISVASSDFQNMSYMWHNCESAARGVQYVELNAGMDGALYQDVLTVPSSTMYWSLAHRGRGTTEMRGGSTLAQDTMYVVVMSTVLAEDYGITTQSAVNDVIANPSKYPGAQVTSITDDNIKWYYHTGEYTVPSDQYLTRYFFVSGATSFDKYSSGSNLARTVGNHLDDIYFSTELPPPASGKVNLEITKNITGLSEDTARELLEGMKFTVDGTTVPGSDFKNFTSNGENSFTASYQVQLDIGLASSVTKTIEEVLTTADVDGYDRTTTTSVNGAAATNTNSATVTIANQGTGKISFTNAYEAKTVTFNINKVDEDDSPLSDAVFSLKASDGENWTDVANDISVDSQGKATIPDLRYDTLYQLTETSAPKGYNTLTSPIYFKIVSDNGAPALSPCDSQGNTIQSWGDQVTSLTGSDIGLKIVNKHGMVLPETGGPGTAYIQIAGICILAVSILFINWTRRKKSKGGSH